MAAQFARLGGGEEGGGGEDGGGNGGEEGGVGGGWGGLGGRGEKASVQKRPAKCTRTAEMLSAVYA